MDSTMEQPEHCELAAIETPEQRELTMEQTESSELTVTEQPEHCESTAMKQPENSELTTEQSVELTMEQSEYTFDLPALFTDYPMIREPLIRLLDRHTQYVLRFVVKCKELAGMKRKQFLEAQIAAHALNMLKWENSYRLMTTMIDQHKVAMDGRLDVLQWLVEINHADIQGALAGAAQGSNEPIIAYLLERGAVITVKIMLCAIESNNIQTVKSLAKRFGGATHFTSTAIVVAKALETKNVEITEWLVRRGCTFGLKELCDASQLNRRLYAYMRKRLDGHTHHNMIEANIRVGNTEFVEWILGRLNYDELSSIKSHGRYKTVSLPVAQWMQTKSLKIDRYGSWKLLIKQGADVSTLNAMRGILVPVIKSAHVYAAKYKRDHITQWLLANVPNCAFNEQTYVRLMEKGCYDLQYLVKYGCPRRPDKFVNICATLILDGKKKELAALREAGCECDIERLWQIANSEMVQWMKDNNW
jgi:hypothetical protein